MRAVRPLRRTHLPSLVVKRGRRLLAAVLVLALVPVAVTRSPAAAKSRPQQQTRLDTPIEGVPLAARARPVDPGLAAAARANSRPAPVWPAAASAVADLSPAPGAPPVRAAGQVYLEEPTSAATVRVETVARATAQAAGIEAMVVRVERVDSSSAPVSVRMSLDYAPFASAYGADWSARLRLVRLPGCALTTPSVPGCAKATPLQSANDHRTRRVSAVVDLARLSTVDRFGDERLVPGTGLVVALTAGPKSDAGDFTATSLAAASTWSAGSNSGDFSWAYTMRAPPTQSAPQPAVTLSYSSQSVDGLMASTNNQPSWVGEGFEWWPGFIERKYASCADDMTGAGHNNSVETGDRCWVTDNATLSLAGHSGELIKDATDPNRWHLRNDDGALITHRTGGGNGDNDGEWWVLTTSEGTQFWFGGTPAANSTWTSPVFGNNPGEPCNQSTFAASSCTQAWRWNLDFVVDTHANTMSYAYVKETNQYARNNNANDVVSYDRGGYLDNVQYGTHTGVPGAAPMKVTFGVADRCLTVCGTHDAVHWPDTPWDQECTGAPCTVGSPTFWTTKRLATVTTHVWDASLAPPDYRNVESWALTHDFRDPGDGTRAGLWLARISHTGLVGTPTTTPDVVFSGVQLPNRVDTIGDQLFPMNWWRISRIDTESGGSIIVNYAPPECAVGGLLPDKTHLENNTLRCYPVRWTPEGAPSPIVDLFHKYVVAEVREGDLTGGAPDVVYQYDYLGGAAWHYTDDDGLVLPENKTWSHWRGYGTVRARTGDPATTAQTREDTQYLRGMHGDHLPSGTRSVPVPAVDLNGDGDTTDAGTDAPATVDEDAYAGTTRATAVYNGVGGAELSATVHEPWRSAPTASRTINGTTVDARFTGTTAKHVRTAYDNDGGARTAGTRSASIATTFDSLGLPVEVDDRGDDAVTGDERCTLTEYTRNMDVATGVWLTGYASRARTFAVGCVAAKAGGLSDAAVTGESRTSFDGQAYGLAPTKGDLTAVQSLKTYNGGSPTFVTTSRAQHDVYGRPTDTWDALNQHVGFAYTPATGGPLTALVRTNEMGWTTTTTFEPAWGATTSMVDPNLLRTDVTYDGLGRRIAVWLPGQDKASGQGATIRYTYLVRTDAATAVTTETLIPGPAYRTAVTLYDGLLRKRQTQQPDAAVAGNRIVTDTLYDSAGRAWKATTPYPMTGPPAQDVYVPRPPDYSGPEAIPSWTVNLFDGAGRTTAAVFLVHNVEKWRTSTSYTGDRVSTTPPAGGTATAVVADARGRHTALRQYHGTTPSGTYDSTSYSHNGKDQLTRVTDPAGNRWDFTFDMVGNQTQAVDPDRGTTTSTYDDAGQLLTTTDARGVVLAHTWDALGRPTSIRDGSTTGPLRAEWTYDTVKKGYPTKSTRYTAGGAYSTEVLSYSPRYQPGIVTYTLPPTETGFGPSQTLSYTTTYSPDSAPATLRIPAAGGLGLETLTFAYNTVGLPSTVNTNLGGTLVTATGYTNYGETGIITLRNNAGSIAQVGQYREEGTHRLTEIKTTSAAAPVTTYADVFYEFDAAGNITKIDDTTSNDHQCYAYDYLRRLTEAWTPASGNCLAARSVAGLGGPAPYWQSWTHDLVGNRLTEVNHATTDTTATYTYPAAGAARPHAPTQVAYTGPAPRTDTYTYDATGGTLTRPGGAAGQTLTWDAEGHVATAVDSTGTTSFVYDADGNRLIRKDPTGKTLYLPGQEIRVTTATGSAAGTRYYTHADRTVAMRTPSGLTWLAGDRQGTTTTAVTAVTQTPSTKRTTPYGRERGTATGWPSTMDKGLIGGTVDNTGLTHLGAREYDPVLGRFISVDPVQDLTDPQQWNGYAYAGNNPMTFSDPSGLMVAPDDQAGNGGVSVVKGGNGKDLIHYTREDVYCYGATCFSGVHVPNRQRFTEKFQQVTARPNAGSETEVELVQVLHTTCSESRNEHGFPGCSSDLIFALSDRWFAAQGKTAMFTGAAVEMGVDAALGAAHLHGAAVYAEYTRQNMFVSPPPECRSFSGETLVLLADGRRVPIQDIRVADLVLATDPETGTTRSEKVTDVWAHDDTLLALDVDGALLTTTEDHPFWNATDGEWEEIQSFDRGDRLLTPDGRTVAVKGLISGSARMARAFNLTVTELHTYYVVAGATPVLVHNTGACPRTWMDPDKLRHHYMSKNNDGEMHAADFGILGDFSKVNGERFVSAIQGFVKAPGTISIRGTFRGQDAIHYVDPSTGLHASFAANGPNAGMYLGGWRSATNSDQFAYLMRDGVL